MTETITGRCNCGRYTVTIPRPKDMNLCHCIECKRWAGATHSAHLFADTDKMQLRGPPPRTHSVKGVNDTTMTRAWCDECGCGLWIRPEAASNFTGVKAGLFDKNDIIAPTYEVFTKDMSSWESTAPTAKKFDKNLER